MKENYLQIGPYSAIGGVSIHIKRLSKLLDTHYNFLFIDESPKDKTISGIYNLRSKNIFKFIGLIKKSDIVHIHSGIWWLRCIHILAAKCMGKKVIVTIHSLTNMKKGIAFSLSRLTMKLATTIIVVSEEIWKSLELKEAIILPAFIPPFQDDEKKLPEEIRELVEFNRDKKLIVSNAFKLVSHEGKDLYGLDLLIEVALDIKKNQRDYLILFVIANANEKSKMYDYYLEQIVKLDLGEVIKIIPYPISFVSLMNESSLVVRATNTDGDALTVREALYLGKPVIASDVITRPEHTIMFKNRDSKDLYLKIDQLLNKTQAITDGHKLDNSQILKEYKQKYLSIITNNTQ